MLVQLRLAVAATVALVAWAATGGTDALAGTAHRWPVVPARVVRGFDPPDQPWGSGHRGVDLHAPGGTLVRASAAGTVTHAGAVAGAAWVTVAHTDGIRTSYGPLATVEVSRGEAVPRGARLGTSAGSGGHLGGLHWSARRGDTYLDPLLLLDGIVVPTLLPGADWRAAELHEHPGYERWDGRDATLGFLPGTTAATAPGWLDAPTPNHVVAVAGLLTNTGSTPLDVSHLGYAVDDTTWFSHAGRSADPGGLSGPDDPLRDQLPYGAADTFGGVDRAAALLEEQLRAQWAREPGVAVDLVGHSLGGVVVLHYLLAHHDPADPGLPPVANVVTLAAPLGGADLVDVAEAATATPGLPGAVAGLARMVLGADARDGTLADLAVGSPLLTDLAGAWADSQADPHRSPLASGTRVLTVGATMDPVVPDHRSSLPGAEHVVVPGGHSGMHRTEAVLQVVRAFLEDRPVPADDGGWGAWLAPGWSIAEHVVAGLVG